jgi:HSP90 family molecular chaperone
MCVRFSVTANQAIQPAANGNVKHCCIGPTTAGNSNRRKLYSLDSIPFPRWRQLKADKAANTLAVSDNGIGMDRQELIDNLGTVARSGARAFMSKLAEAKDGTSLIGQFGVGFYSAFMVADRIEVVSRRAGSPQAWLWLSSGGAGFDISPATEAQAALVPRGTEIVLHLKDDAKKYLEPYEIRRVTGNSREECSKTRN